MSKQSVLVIAKEEVISSLLGAMVELDGFTAVFPRDDERPVDAITRLNPALVLLDGEHDLAWDQQAMAAVRELSVRVLLISALRSQQELEMFGDRHHLPSLALPFRFRDFADHIGRLIRPPIP